MIFFLLVGVSHCWSGTRHAQIRAWTGTAARSTPATANVTS